MQKYIRNEFNTCIVESGIINSNADIKHDCWVTPLFNRCIDS